MDFKGLYEQVSKCENREEGEIILNKLNKKELLKFAAKNDIFVKSTLEKKWVVDKLVASIIGVKINFRILKGDL